MVEEQVEGQSAEETECEPAVQNATAGHGELLLDVLLAVTVPHMAVIGGWKPMRFSRQ